MISLIISKLLYQPKQHMNTKNVKKSRNESHGNSYEKDHWRNYHCDPLLSHKGEHIFVSAEQRDEKRRDRGCCSREGSQLIDWFQQKSLPRL